jgi:hypothetical protein
MTPADRDAVTGQYRATGYALLASGSFGVAVATAAYVAELQLRFIDAKSMGFFGTVTLLVGAWQLLSARRAR